MTQLNSLIGDWYVSKYPTDDLGKDIPNTTTFLDVLTDLPNVYDYIVGDSIVRERVFAKLADMANVDYDIIELAANNSLIAEFMGREVHTDGITWFDEKLKSFTYHSDWNELMAAVSKCYEYGELHNQYREDIIESLSGVINMPDTFNAVLAFIKWYSKKRHMRSILKKSSSKYQVIDMDGNILAELTTHTVREPDGYGGTDIVDAYVRVENYIGNKYVKYFRGRDSQYRIDQGLLYLHKTYIQCV